MPNLTSVGIASGVPNSGTGTVSTIDALMADGGQATLGAKADAANTATDVTPISGISVWKQISKTLQAAAGAVSTAFFSKVTDGTNTVAVKAASTAPAATDPSLVIAVSPNSWDLTPGTGGSKTQRVAIDTSQLAALATTGQAMSAGYQLVNLPTDTAPISIAVAPTVTAAAYTANNEVGGLMTFSSAGRAPNASGVLQDVTLTSKTVQTVEFDLYLFNSNPSNSTWTDKTAPAINAADVNKLIGVVKLTKNYSGLGTHTVYKPDETTFAPIPFSGATLYGVLVTPGTPTFGSTSDLTVTLGIV